MRAKELRGTRRGAAPPDGLPMLVEALWWEAHGDWGRAHAMVDALETADGTWVHAHLHRSEGDLGNARFWYAQAGRPMSRESLEAEWLAMVEELLGRAY